MKTVARQILRAKLKAANRAGNRLSSFAAGYPPKHHKALLASVPTAKTASARSTWPQWPTRKPACSRVGHAMAMISARLIRKPTVEDSQLLMVLTGGFGRAIADD